MTDIGGFQDHVARIDLGSDGVVPDEKLDDLEIEIGPGIGISDGGSGAAIPSDD
ncbi:hypothetical protein JMJ58_23960 (plasmid) [Haloterrigena salifodinae]|uniref:Uncharacterized protein n=1 Tax=Haloterrigena salifodinae TaxID=2675099 RepID=A0A8T8E854_9EURY|nr:hypothetical protein [Haloterrigena salifodinae]QRV18004.1 hypothetical protein JMJ58_23960 [Haloterrigena salifodinae]